MSKESERAINGLVGRGVFAVLVAETAGGEIVIRPIGGSYDYNITNVAIALDEQYPGCKMRLFEQNYDSFGRYFKKVISKDRLI